MLFCVLWFLGILLLLGMRLRMRLLLSLLLLDLLTLLLRLDALRGLRLTFLLALLTFLSLNRHCVLWNTLLRNLARRSCLWIYIGVAEFRPPILTDAWLPILLAAVDLARFGALLYVGRLRLWLLLHHLIHNRRALC